MHSDDVDQRAVEAVNRVLGSAPGVPSGDGHLAWVLTRVEEVTRAAGAVGLQVQEVVVSADEELTEHLADHFPETDRYTELRARTHGEVLVLLEEGEPLGCGYELRVLTGNGWVDLALHPSVSFAYPGVRSAAEVEVRWKLQVEDGVDPETAREAAAALGT